MSFGILVKVGRRNLLETILRITLTTQETLSKLTYALTVYAWQDVSVNQVHMPHKREGKIPIARPGKPLSMLEDQ